ncbi:MAG: hypothetical protein QM640_07555, partial [Niabella sp.]
MDEKVMRKDRSGWRSFLRPVLVFFSLMLLLCVSANAQEFRVKAYTDKNRILIGEPLLLTLEVKALHKIKVPSFSIDSIPHFEFLNK